MARRKRRTKYEAREGSPISDEQAKVLGAVFEQIDADGRLLTAPTLLGYAEDARSPIHSFFDWDDESAAHKHRLERAGTLIGSVIVINIKTRRMTRARRSILVKDGDGRVRRAYEPIQTIIGEQSGRDQLSVQFYQRLCSVATEVLALGLDGDDAAWRRLVTAINSNVPQAVKKSGFSTVA